MTEASFIARTLLVFGLLCCQGIHGLRAEEPAGALANEAEAASRAGDPGDALVKWQGAWDKSQQLGFRLWVESKVNAMIAPLSEARLLVEASRLAPNARIRALLEARRAELLIRAGQEDKARAILQRPTAGLDAQERRDLLAAAGLPDHFGALVPLTGPLRAMGREILRGMLLASGLVGRAMGATASIEVRDSETDPAGGARELIHAGVLAIIGVPSSAGARKAGPTCQRAGVPLITGADGHGVPALGSHVFRGVHAPATRARALAIHLSRARPKGLVAVVHPESAYGRRTAEAFVQEATRLGLTVSQRVSYPARETNLYPRFRPLQPDRLDAVFVAESALRLEIVAPQLALAGLGPSPKPQLVPKGRRGAEARPLLLLSTAEGLRERLVKNVAQAVEGAVLAPGFFPDLQDPSMSAFVAAYRLAYGHLPGRYAALGYLWVLELRSLMVNRAKGRVSLRGALGAFRGQDHARIFDDQGERVDPPRLYHVKQGQISRLGQAKPQRGERR
ncbi:MAG: ABC transporter substrate-binding protein [Polyangia bacterium]|jgi:ABC-type branched-subunit amino acid transport system substrate-binding protein|nr:ABC transporter substrate-binding protein [Polyangia bacterium]